MKIIEKLRKFSPGKNTEKYYTKTPHKNITQILHKNITQKYYKNITQKYYTKILHKQTYGYYTQEPIRTTLRQNTNATNCDILYTTLKFTAPHHSPATHLLCTKIHQIKLHTTLHYTTRHDTTLHYTHDCTSQQLTSLSPGTALHCAFVMCASFPLSFVCA
jgi:hypothetical protein